MQRCVKCPNCGLFDLNNKIISSKVIYKKHDGTSIEVIEERKCSSCQTMYRALMIYNLEYEELDD